MYVSSWPPNNAIKPNKPIFVLRAANPMRANRLLQLLLRAELVGVTALLLSAVGGTGGKAGLAETISMMRNPGFGMGSFRT